MKLDLLWIVAIAASNSAGYGALATGIVEQVCHAVVGTVNEICDQTVSIPTTFEILTKDVCNNNCCTWDCGQWSNACCAWSDRKCAENCCCTGSLFNAWCGCSASKCGETCVNVPQFGCSESKCGTVEMPCSGCSASRCGTSCTEVPDTLKMKWEDKTYCELLGIGGVDDAVEKVAQYCPCLDEALEFLEDGLTDVADSGDISSATTAALESAASIVDCLATSSGAYSSEKYEIMKNEEDKGGILIPGEEISLKLYAQLAGSVALCATAAKCDDILNTMTGFWDDTVEAVSDSLVAALRAYVANAVEPIQVNLQTFTSIMDEFENSAAVCTEDVESQTVSIAATYDAISDNIKGMVSTTIDLIDDIEDTALAIYPAIDDISNALDAMAGSFTERIIESIKEGSLDQLSSLVKAVEFIGSDNDEVQKVISSGEQVEDMISELKDNLSELKDDATQLRILLNDFVNADGCKSEAASLMNFIETASQKFVDELKVEKLEIQSGIASYSSKLEVRIDNLPCFKLVQRTFGDENLCPGCSVKLDVPVFEPCSAEFDIPLPKQHTPYLRVVYN